MEIELVGYLHIISQSNLSILISNYWEGQFGATDLIDIFDPSSVALNGVCRQSNQLDTSFCELRLELGESTEFGSADRSVIFWVGEEDNPLITNEFVEIDRALGGIGLEVWGNGTETETGRKSVIVWRCSIV